LSNQKEADISVTMSLAQQSALVGHCMFNEELLNKCKIHLRPEWLNEDVLVAHVYKELVKFYSEYESLPTSSEELLSEPFFRAQKQQDLVSYKNTLTAIIVQAQNFNIELLRNKVASFVQYMNLKEAVKSAVVGVTKTNYAALEKAQKDISKALINADFDTTKYVDFSDTMSLWTKEEEVSEKLMSTGSRLLDQMLGGGLAKKENLAVLAPTFTGKSRFLITLVRHLLVQNKKVLFVIHEDNPTRVKQRIISSMVGVGPREIKAIMKRATKYNPFDGVDVWTEQDESDLFHLIEGELKIAKEILMENLIFLEWRKPGKMYVEDVIAEIQRINQEQRVKTGVGIDVLIEDYPMILGTRSRQENKRDAIAYVYQEFNTLAAEENFFVAYAVQVNRHAAKEMKSGEATQAINLEDTSESYQVAQNAMSAVSLNRMPSDIDKHILRIAVIKARENDGYRMMSTRSAYNECVLFGDFEMFKDCGKMLYEGLSNIKSSQDMQSSDTIDNELHMASSQITMDKAEILNKVPGVVKKLKKDRISLTVTRKDDSFGKNR
jgi:hypothetical protein